LRQFKEKIHKYIFGTLCETEKQNFRVPLLVLVEALLTDALLFLKITLSPDTIVEPADTSDLPLIAFELHRLAPMMKEMLPPQTWTNFVRCDDNAQSNFTLTNIP
jgi:hypothetical protein